MGRGPVVAAAKEKNAKAKAKINTLHAKLIAIAAEKGSDISLNTSLADAIHSAKKDGVTADVIDRAIKRGAGLDKDSQKVEEIIYEGYAPGGVAIIVRALSDNRNRTAPNMRHIFSAYGGSLGETGTVSNFAFDYRGVISLTEYSNSDELEMAIMETSAEDYTLEGSEARITTDRTKLSEVRKSLEESGYKIEKSSFEYLPKNYIEVTDFDIALKIYKMLEEFHEDEDVEVVWNNADISDALWKEVEMKVESSKFRT
ncbi:MAG: YebC/PmpR family DNA-binding transcriptional regulator [Candidatus Altimarinota bacterium]